MASLPDRRVTEVPLGERAYTIIAGAGLIDDSDLWADLIRDRHVVVVTDDNVAPLYLDRVERGLLAASGRLDSFVLPAGETSKTPQTWLDVIDRMTALQARRDCLLVALGGGVVGDITGFVAASYMRGVDFAQCPTTVLAQVDSSVGGKTGVNHPQGKNLIGAFHQPRAVAMDVGTLATLSDREYAAGLAETVKYGAIMDAGFLGWLEDRIPALRARDVDTLTQAVARACACKAAVVAEDEREQGVRALLNFGHTFGHAIEAATGYTRLLHGEAVAIGMCVAAEHSVRIGLCQPADADRLRTLLSQLGLPVTIPPDLDAQRLWELMQLDKKNRKDQVRLILMRRIGDCVAQAADDAAPVLASLDTSLRGAA